VIVCVTLGLVAGRLSSYLRRSDGASTTTTHAPQPQEKANTTLPAPTVPSPPMMTPTPEPPHPTAPRPRPPAPALLEVTADVPARVDIDGKSLGNTPLAHLALAAGEHHVHIEAIEGAMRLLPHEETLKLSAGEHRTLNVELR
jgi:hypothetical protein